MEDIFYSIEFMAYSCQSNQIRPFKRRSATMKKKAVFFRAANEHQINMRIELSGPASYQHGLDIRPKPGDFIVEGADGYKAYADLALQIKKWFPSHKEWAKIQLLILRYVDDIFTHYRNRDT